MHLRVERKKQKFFLEVRTRKVNSILNKNKKTCKEWEQGIRKR